MEQRISATEVRIHFGEIMRRCIDRGEKFIIDKDGKPQVAILSVQSYERLKKAQARETWRLVLDRAVQLGAKLKTRRQNESLTPPEQVIRHAREVSGHARLNDMH